MSSKPSELEIAIATEVWFEKIDGQTTCEIADRHKSTPAKALRILKKIVEGRSSVFPFIYDSDFQGVVVGNNNSGRIFIGNNQAEDGHRPHYYWFFT